MSPLPAPSNPSVAQPAAAGGASERYVRRLIWLCLAVAAVRLISLPFYPLIDRTESRYALIATEMALDGDWVTPRLHGDPFWGKPALSTWCQAASIKVFGVNEFAVRFPGWLVVLLAGFFVWRVARTWLTTGRAWIAAAVFTAAPLTLLMGGGVMTDPYLLLGLTISLYGLARWCSRDATDPRDAWRVAAWYGVGLAVGTLAKGPIAVVFGGAPLLALGLTRAGRAHLRAWPWLRSIAVFALLAVPWFLAAEARTPGFLEYFFVGEHWHRFVQPDWKGDLYGGTHPKPRGMVWLYFLIGFATWLPGVFIAWRTRRERKRTDGDADPMGPVLWVSTLTPLIVFTFAGSVLLPYVLPAIPAACVLLARTLLPRGSFQALAFVTVACVLSVMALPLVPTKFWAQHSHKPLLAGLDYDRIVYCRVIDTMYSAHFYSGRRAVAVRSLGPADWASIRQSPHRTRFATKRRELTGVPDDIKARLVVERESDNGYQVWRFK